MAWAKSRPRRRRHISGYLRTSAHIERPRIRYRATAEPMASIRRPNLHSVRVGSWLGKIGQMARAPSIATTAMFLVSSPAAAHAFGARYDLPLPLEFYVIGAGAAVALSFVIIAVVFRSQRGRDEEPWTDLRRIGLMRALPPWSAILGRRLVCGRSCSLGLSDWRVARQRITDRSSDSPTPPGSASGRRSFCSACLPGSS